MRLPALALALLLAGCRIGRPDMSTPVWITSLDGEGIHWVSAGRVAMARVANCAPNGGGCVYSEIAPVPNPIPIPPDTPPCWMMRTSWDGRFWSEWSPVMCVEG